MWPDIARGYVSGLATRGSVRRRGIRVYCYHGVVDRIADRVLERNFHDVKTFRAQLRFLKRFPILSLPEAVELLAQRRVPRHASVLTFDDGYANNLQAAEILADAKLPWAVFVTTAAVGDAEIIWTIELSLLLLHGRASAVTAAGRHWPLATKAARELAFQSVRRAWKQLSADHRLEAMDALRAQFPAGESARVRESFPSFRMMRWDEVRQLAAAGVEVGSHGEHHELHHYLQPVDVRRVELAQSRRVLEQQLSRRCRFFAYPNGDFVATSPDEVREAGYDAALTTRPESVTNDAHTTLMPRLGPPGRLWRFARHFYWRPKRR